MVQTAIANNIAIWGIDQEAQISFPYNITRAYNNLPPDIKVKNKPLFDSLIKKWYFPKGQLLDSLKELVKNKEDEDRINEIKLSKAIYANYGNNDYTMNTDRVRLMKTHFFNNLAAYQKKYSTPVKVFFKMGSNHLTKGFTLSTHQLDMGNLANELAISQKSSYSNVQFIARYFINNEGKTVDRLLKENDGFSKFFMAYYQKDIWVVIDVRPLRSTLSTKNLYLWWRPRCR